MIFKSSPQLNYCKISSPYIWNATVILFIKLSRKRCYLHSEISEIISVLKLWMCYFKKMKIQCANKQQLVKLMSSFRWLQGKIYTFSLSFFLYNYSVKVTLLKVHLKFLFAKVKQIDFHAQENYLHNISSQLITLSICQYIN